MRQVRAITEAVRGKLPRTTGRRPVLPRPGSRSVRIPDLSLARFYQMPVPFHRRDIGGGETGGDINLPIRNAFIDLQLGNGATIDKDEQKTSASLDAQRIEAHLSMLIELKECTV